VVLGSTIDGVKRDLKGWCKESVNTRVQALKVKVPGEVRKQIIEESWYYGVLRRRRLVMCG